MSYYLLGRSSALRPCRHADHGSFSRDRYWDDGARFETPVDEPFTVSLEPLDPYASDEGPDLPALFPTRTPLYRDDLLAALRAAGVDNLDTYEAVIIDPDDGTRHTNYKAVNIIGLVAAADMAESEAIVNDGIPLIDVGFDKLVLDESKTQGLLMFRLAENNSAVLVHERVKKALLDAGFDELDFHDLERAAIL